MCRVEEARIARRQVLVRRVLGQTDVEVAETGQSAAVDRVVDRAPQADVPEDASMCVEDVEVELGRSVGEYRCRPFFAASLPGPYRFASPLASPAGTPSAAKSAVPLSTCWTPFSLETPTASSIRLSRWGRLPW